MMKLTLLSKRGGMREADGSARYMEWIGIHRRITVFDLDRAYVLF